MTMPTLRRIIPVDARNSALSRRSVQIHQELGLWDALQEHATPI